MTAQWIKRLVELALENLNAGGGPFAALIVRNGSVVAEGVNRVTTGNDPTAHAEITAIREACHALNTFQLTGCDLYASCEPCPMCLGAIYWARLDRVFYAATRDDATAAGFEDSLIYREVALPPDQRRLPMVAVGREDALEIFRGWARKQDKVRY